MRRLGSPLLVVIFVSGCFGYVRQITRDATPIALSRADHAGIQFSLNNLVVPGAQTGGKTVISGDSDPAEAVRAALATWNGVNTSSARFRPLKSTALGIDPG